MKIYKPIACELHDYLESIVVMRLKVELTTCSGALVGCAHDVFMDDKKQEWISFSVKNGNKLNIRLDQLVKLRVLSPNAPFDTVVF